MRAAPRNARRPQVSSDRRAMLAKIHLAAKELRLPEETRRDIIERETGHRSSADCTDAQLDQLVAVFKRMGFQPKVGKASAAARPAGPKAATSPIALKARALWKSLDQLGALSDGGSERSLEAFAKRQLRVDRLQWADQSQGFRLIEALKAWAEREGWSQDLTGVSKGQEVISLKRRLVQRQAEILGKPPFRLAGMTEREIDALARENAPAVKAARAEEAYALAERKARVAPHGEIQTRRARLQQATHQLLAAELQLARIQRGLR